MAQNMMWDGLFHAATLLIVLVGVFMLWREGQTGRAPDSRATLIGQMFFGWGVFNIVEGIIDHHLLNLHHVRDIPVHVPLYDWLFLLIGGLGFLTVGAMLMRRAPSLRQWRSGQGDRCHLVQ